MISFDDAEGVHSVIDKQSGLSFALDFSIPSDSSRVSSISSFKPDGGYKGSSGPSSK